MESKFLIGLVLCVCVIIIVAIFSFQTLFGQNENNNDNGGPENIVLNCSVVIYWKDNNSTQISNWEYNYSDGLPSITVNITNTGNVDINISTYTGQLMLDVNLLLPNGTKSGLSSYVPLGKMPDNNTYGYKLIKPNESYVTSPATWVTTYYHPEIINTIGTYRIYIIVNEEFISNEISITITKIE